MNFHDHIFSSTSAILLWSMTPYFSKTKSWPKHSSVLFIFQLRKKFSISLVIPCLSFFFQNTSSNQVLSTVFSSSSSFSYVYLPKKSTVFSFSKRSKQLLQWPRDLYRSPNLFNFVRKKTTLWWQKDLQRSSSNFLLLFFIFIILFIIICYLLFFKW